MRLIEIQCDVCVYVKGIENSGKKRERKESKKLYQYCNGCGSKHSFENERKKDEKNVHSVEI